MPAPPWFSHSVMDANPGDLSELSSWTESQALGSDILVAYKHQCTTMDSQPSTTSLPICYSAQALRMRKKT